MWTVDDLKMSKMPMRRLVIKALSDCDSLRELLNRREKVEGDVCEVHDPVVYAASEDRKRVDQNRLAEFNALVADMEDREARFAVIDSVEKKYSQALADAAARLALAETARKRAIESAVAPIDAEMDRLEKKHALALKVAYDSGAYRPAICCLTGLPILNSDTIVDMSDTSEFGHEDFQHYVIGEAIAKLSMLRLVTCDTSDSLSARDTKKTRKR